MKNDWGFTNDKAEYDAVCVYRDAAVADGWDIKPTYAGEPVERAARLTKDGFVMQVITREKSGKWAYEANLHIWAPDGLCLLPGKTYDWNQIQGAVRHCANCGKDDVDTHRYSFAGRCCKDCLPAMRAKHEYPGWDN